MVRHSQNLFSHFVSDLFGFLVVGFCKYNSKDAWWAQWDIHPECLLLQKRLEKYVDVYGIIFVPIKINVTF